MKLGVFFLAKEFIFPMNYKKKEKFLGFIDYKCLAIIGSLAFFMFLLLKNISLDITVKVVLFIIVVGFFSILILFGVNGENMLNFLYFVFKYLIKEKVYVYRKVDNERRSICESLLSHGLK